MRRGWEVTLKDDTVLNEDNTEWKDVPKVKIKVLSLLYDGRRWDLSDKQAYFIRNKASMVPGIAESFKVERRCIGYYEGAKKIHYTVEEDTGKFNMEVIDNGAS